MTPEAKIDKELHAATQHLVKALLRLNTVRELIPEPGSDPSGEDVIASLIEWTEKATDDASTALESVDDARTFLDEEIEFSGGGAIPGFRG